MIPLTDEQLNDIGEEVDIALFAQKRSIAISSEDARALIEEIRRLRAENEKLRSERDRLAHDALAVLSANGVATPEKGYTAEPYMLALDIKCLAIERDTAVTELSREKRAGDRLVSFLKNHCRCWPHSERCDACKAIDSAYSEAQAIRRGEGSR